MSAVEPQETALSEETEFNSLGVQKIKASHSDGRTYLCFYPLAALYLPILTFHTPKGHSTKSLTHASNQSLITTLYPKEQGFHVYEKNDIYPAPPF